tara:strand:- start:847 stop:1479 length:633 start_codon:yes stop_codon:yes gene_type:complete
MFELDGPIDLENWVFDCTPYVKYTADQQLRMKQRFLYEMDVNKDNIVTNKVEHSGRKYGITSEGIVGKKPVMNGWGRVHVLEQRSDPDRPNVFKEVVSQLPELPEDRSWNWQYFLDNTVPFHKDPSTHCWLGIMVMGDQDIEFAIDEGPKQKDGIFIGKINYKVALINSKELHSPVSDGNSRCILRYVFLETSYNDVKNLLKEHFKCGSG